MIVVHRNGKQPMYEQIYESLKEAIECGVYDIGARLPSIRALAEELGVSKITVEQAYLQLSMEGYIKAHHKAPYEVIHQGLYDPNGSMPRVDDMTLESTMMKDSRLASSELGDLLYNFATGAMDPEGFDFSRWKRHIGYVLRSPRNLMAYGSPRGELALRVPLSRYLNAARGVISTPNHIVVSSGSQFSLMLLALLLKNKGIKTIALGITDTMVYRIFKDVGFSIVEYNQNEENFIKALQESKVECVYCTPSHGDNQGRLMTINQRQALLRWSRECNGYIIEDDYDSELRYYGKPISSLQGLSRGEKVIYVGTPSKVLPPSIRLSFMVLPDELNTMYEEEFTWYRQSAGVMEQLVWASYMESGEWQKQIRRLRKHYLEKSRYMAELLQQALRDIAVVTVPEGGVYISLDMKTTKSLDELEALALSRGCKIRRDGKYILLSFSGIDTKRLPKAVEELKIAWNSVV